MPTDLRDIRKFPELVRYLESELDWPVEAASFDDLTFEYVPAELGLKETESVAIKKIHQLRPLASGQPWGVFFVEFEKKKLPVVVLRRILSHLVIRKRNSANQSDRAAWNPHDLLFISTFGEESSDQREIAFAHFHQQDGDLPTLQVLGWDGGDTPLKLEHVAGELREKLHWPANPKDHAAWRTQWSRAFRHKLGHTVRTADDLAEVLAALARGIRARCTVLMRAESDHGPLTKLFKAFQAALIHDLNEETFADTYAQTITYGLLTAAINRTDMSGGTEATYVKADDLTLMVRVTSPFLKEMLETFLTVGGRKNGVDFDELGIQDVVELLRGNETDLPAILRDFGNRTRGEDPVIHFYEHFLSAYNKKLKIQRGVFYTPQPVVSYIVRSVHELLQTEFGLEDGLASTVTWGEMISRSSRGNEAQTSPAGKQSEPPHVGGYDEKDAANVSPSPPAAGGEGRGEVGQSSNRKSEIVNRKLTLPTVNEPGEPEKTISPGEPFVQILDPATGTATFLVEVIDVIFKHLKAKWDKGGLAAMPPVSLAPSDGERAGVRGSSPIVNSFTDYWNLYVPQHLLPRLHGYELLAAPYAIAHLKLGLKLTETGYRFGSAERARIYLTNALEPKVRQLPQIGFEPLAHEAQAVNEIKWYKRFTVVIGNPPYSAAAGSTQTGFLTDIMSCITSGLGVESERKKGALQDEYIRFIALSRHIINTTNIGVVGLITNNSYLDGTLHRAMRKSLMEAFPRLVVANLHGSSRAGTGGAADENVFDIMQGVAVIIAARVCRSSSHELPPAMRVRYGELLGSRDAKYQALSMGSVTFIEFVPAPPYHLLRPLDSSHFDEYEKLVSLRDVFRIFSSGIETEKDHFAMDFEVEPLRERLREFCDLSVSPKDVADRFNLKTTPNWDLVQSRKAIANEGLKKDLFTRYLFHCFDWRFTYYSDHLVTRSRRPVMRHMRAGNLALITLRQVKGEPWAHAFVCTDISNKFTLSSKSSNVSYHFPLYLTGDDSQHSLALRSQREPNFTPAFLKSISAALRTPKQGAHGLPDGVTPEDIFHYAYAVLHSPGYRSRYAEFLKIDFPRLPLTGNLELFRALARLGGELTPLHLLEFEVGRVTPCAPSSENQERRARSDAPYQPLTEFIPSPPSHSSPPVEKVSWSANTVWLDKAQTTGFKGVREDVWNFHIGGYQVCEKWLKDRKGRPLTADDRTHYQKIIIALSETIRLMKEIDTVIEKHGGWPLK